MYEIKYRKAKEMKDSGIEWLGKIPKEWDKTKLKYVSEITTGNTPSKKDYKNYENGIYEWIKPDDILDNYSIKKSKEKLASKGLKQARLIKRYSSVVCCIGSIGKVGFASYDLTTNQQINSITFDHKKYDYKYGFYCLVSCKQEHEKKSNKVVVAILNKENQGNIKLPVLDISEQQKIANFLDIKTAEFDSIISKKEKLIEKLEEAKKSLISDVVTGKVKIVDGKLVKRKPEEMKDSGVEWLGMIPKDWEVKKLGFIFSFKNGINADASKYGKGIKFINVKEVIDNETLNYEQIPNKVTISKASIVENKVKKGDVLLNRTSETREELGLSAVYIDDKEVVFGGFVIRGREKSNDLTLEFKKYFLSSYEARKQIILYSSGSIRKNIGQNALKNVYITFPDYEEQEKISKFLEKKIVLLMSMISKTKTQIQKLKEAKQSLISEAVTGKIDLRDWEIIEQGE